MERERRTNTSDLICRANSDDLAIRATHTKMPLLNTLPFYSHFKSFSN